MKPWRRISLSLFALMVCALLGTMPKALAADTVTITLHKEAFVVNNATNTQNQSTSVSTGKPLADVQFAVYDATALYREALTSPHFKAKSWIQSWSQKTTVELQQAGFQAPLQLQTTNEAGDARFNLTQSDATAYLFVQKSKLAEGQSAPTMILLSLTSQNGKLHQTNIRIALKSTRGTIDPPETPSSTSTPPSSQKRSSESMTTITSQEKPIKQTTRKGFLPQTGEAKVQIGCLGFLIILISLYLFRKQTNKKMAKAAKGENK